MYQFLYTLWSIYDAQLAPVIDFLIRSVVGA